MRIFTQSIRRTDDTETICLYVQKYISETEKESTGVTTTVDVVNTLVYISCVCFKLQPIS